MKLLFDQNLSFKLCTVLSDLFPDSKPVRELGLDRSEDRIVWLRVRINQAANIVDHAALDYRLLEWQSTKGDSYFLSGLRLASQSSRARLLTSSRFSLGCS
jgi:hypothetical protein